MEAAETEKAIKEAEERERALLAAFDSDYLNEDNDADIAGDSKQDEVEDSDDDEKQAGKDDDKN